MSDISIHRRLNENPVHLAHYTNFQGAIEILNSMCIWANCSDYQNDYTEINQSVEIIIEALNRNICGTNIQNITRIISILQANMDSLKRRVFITSLTEEKDLLSQWRGYGNDGRGVCIVFKVSDINYKIENYNNIQSSNWRLLPVLYNNMAEKELFISHITEVIQKHNMKNLSEVEFSNLYSELESLSMFIKSSDFYEEKEWRIVQMLKSTIATKDDIPRDFSLRVNTDKLIPYFKIPFNKNAVKEIIIGPKCDFDKSKYSLDIYRIKNGYNFDIIKSKISYR